MLHGQLQWTHGARALIGAARRGRAPRRRRHRRRRPGRRAAGGGLQLDFLAANRLETADGRLTGRIVGEVVGGGGRGRALVRFAESYGMPLAQSVAVGCGPEAAELLRLAGLGVVVDAARPTEGAPERSAHLDALQFLLGLRADDPDGAGPFRRTCSPRPVARR